MDLKSGYYQVEMEEVDKCKTVFVTPMGFWEFNRMPQGFTNAPYFSEGNGEVHGWDEFESIGLS